MDKIIQVCDLCAINREAGRGTADGLSVGRCAICRRDLCRAHSAEVMVAFRLPGGTLSRVEDASGLFVCAMDYAVFRPKLHLERL